jgi:hypothetical protein
MNAVTINSIRLNVDTWQVREQSDRYLVWDNSISDLLSLSFCPVPLTSQIGLSATQKLQDFHRLYRKTIQQSGGTLISVDIVSMKGVSAIKALFMFPKPHRSQTYVGSLTFPFRDFSYVVKIQCQKCDEEQGISHPLIRTRRVLSELEANIELSDEILQAIPLQMLVQPNATPETGSPKPAIAPPPKVLALS